MLPFSKKGSRQEGIVMSHRKVRDVMTTDVVTAPSDMRTNPALVGVTVSGGVVTLVGELGQRA